MIKVNNLKDSAEIYIHGDIIDDFASNFIDGLDGFVFPKAIKDELDSIGEKPITVYINSDGGSVPAGVAIANMLKRHKAKTTAVIDGWCCSIATQIFFSCQERQIPKNAYLMIHKPSCTTVGDANELRKTAEALDTIQKGLEEVYRAAAKEHITDEDITKYVNQESWFTGEEASEIFNITLLDEVKAVAKFGSGKNQMLNIPKDICFESKNKELKKVEKIEGEKNTQDIENQIEINLKIAETELNLCEKA
ncbi:head maturation protease, ClpP-related [Dialister micraerophilus]|uniref:ATP-dependent Clp protease proteolytic subunit n=1 Tax=Dialister micraerophilus UPII 345-E TaxID=910314 RepID=E4L8B2_9FIRM|nr:head maturation protease, ClpP-related [Dialister micraerophilus]EFR43003.1 endopeptidase Clp [Dialister micraerophilus UPII 345-E]